MTLNLTKFLNNGKSQRKKLVNSQFSILLYFNHNKQIEVKMFDALAKFFNRELKKNDDEFEKYVEF